MMKAMGGGMPGMGANRTPEEHKKEVEALRAVSALDPSNSKKGVCPCPCGIRGGEGGR